MTMRSVINTNPQDIHEGDTFTVTVTFHVGFKCNGKPQVRAYRCPYPNPELSMEDGTPQGDGISSKHVKTLMEALVPVLTWADAEPDPTA